MLVTRPIHQCVFLANGIRTLGGNPILLPVLEIADVDDLKPVFNIIDRLHEFDWALFVSPNAVNKAVPLITQRHALPRHLKIATVGKGSADALHQYGIDNVLIPDGQSDSEGLLKRAELQHMIGQRVVIFRGQGGRPLLGDTLRQRGAQVEYAECYLRKIPAIDTGPLLSAWSSGQIHAVIITSSEGLHNLFDIIGALGQQLLKFTPIFTAHERIAQIARELGLEKVIRSASTGDEGLLESLQQYFSAAR